MDDEPRERQLNIHLDPEHLAGAYANFANVTFSPYEFTITFARIEHEVEDQDVPGSVVSRVNMSSRFMRELLDAMDDAIMRIEAAVRRSVDAGDPNSIAMWTRTGGGARYDRRRRWWSDHRDQFAAALR